MNSKNNCKRQTSKPKKEFQINVDFKSAHSLYPGIKNWAIKNLWNALIIDPKKENAQKPVKRIVKPIL